MKVIPFEKLYNTEFFISEPMAKTQVWGYRGNVYDAFGKPKVSHTLLWFKNCRGRLTSADGSVLDIERNQLAYMAKGIEYRIDFFDTGVGDEDTVVVHFQMTDKEGEDILPTAQPFVCINQIRPSFAMDLDALAAELKRISFVFPRRTPRSTRSLPPCAESKERMRLKAAIPAFAPALSFLRETRT